jgi:alanyl-tRNA synthetase
MTSAEIRQSFLDFFKEKQHTIVPSSSLLPDSPNLLFTNAGMNQFVPIFLGNSPCPYTPGRAADTQKCIRAGGKHNDLEDVGFDTYHHTFFEMLGNWSFGNYFKKEAIAWAWELVVGRWHFPAERLYATVYKPDPSKGDPAEFDQEAYDAWAVIFKKAGLDPAVHIKNGNKKDNFWMMGETGPCGPCSELHVDLTPKGDTKGSLVNAGDPRCIEIWNLVFMQFNANADGTFIPLPAQNVDTGMGFERVCSIMQCSKGLTDFANARFSNYETDVFQPLFAAIEKLTGKKYAHTLPAPGQTTLSEQEKIDIAFRVISDHVRTLSFSVADGIIPSNEGRGYVLRRILRRAVRYGRNLGLHEPFLYNLVGVLDETMSPIFPEIKTRRAVVEKTIHGEEESFIKTLEHGIALFDEAAQSAKNSTISGEDAFKLYDTYGFPLDLTQLMARERGLSVDEAGFDTLMAEQKKRSQAAQKKEVITVSVEGDGKTTEFVGYDKLEFQTTVVLTDGDILVTEKSPFYSAMGGQVSDHGTVDFLGNIYTIVDVQKSHDGAILHKLSEAVTIQPGAPVTLKVDVNNRARIEAHHTCTHLMHWALRQVLGSQVGQKGSYVGPDRLRFDFSYSEAMTPEQIAEVEKLVNERVEANDPVSWEEHSYKDIKGDEAVMQFFGDKYGDTVRLVSVGNYSRELCGGTHVRQTGRIGYFKLLSESAIAAGIRRIEAVTGNALIDYVHSELLKQEERHSILRKRRVDLVLLKSFKESNSPLETWKSFAARQVELEKLESDVREWEKQNAKEQAASWQKEAAAQAEQLVATAHEKNGVPFLTAHIADGPGAYLPVLVDALKNRWKGVAVIARQDDTKAALIASVAPAFSKKVMAGKIIQAIAPVVGGKGGGRPELAQGGGSQPEKIDEALARVETLI